MRQPCRFPRSINLRSNSPLLIFGQSYFLLLKVTLCLLGCRDSLAVNVLLLCAMTIRALFIS